MTAPGAPTKGDTSVLLLITTLLLFGIVRSIAPAGNQAMQPIRVEFSAPPSPVAQPLFPGQSSP